MARLDGYTAADAKALVSRALDAEKVWWPMGKSCWMFSPALDWATKRHNRLAFRMIDIKHESPWSEFNADMRKAHDILAGPRHP